MSSINESPCRSRKGHFSCINWYTLRLAAFLLGVKSPEGKRTVKGLWVSGTSGCQVSNTFIHRLHPEMSEVPSSSWSPLSPRSKCRTLSRHLPSLNTDLTSQPQTTALLALRNLPFAAWNMRFFSPYFFWSSYPTQMYNISFWRKKK